MKQVKISTPHYQMLVELQRRSTSNQLNTLRHYSNLLTMVPCVTSGNKEQAKG